MHLGRVYEVQLTLGAGQSPVILGASGTFNMVVLAGMYNWFPGDWVIFAGGGIYFAALDYRYQDILFSGGQETRWTVSASGLAARIGADYVLPNRVFLGLGVDIAILSSLSGSRIDEYNSHGGISDDLSSLSVVIFRVGYGL